MKTGVAGLMAILVLFCGCGHSQPQIGIEPFAEGLTNPVDIKSAGDGRLFVVEQDGYIVVLDSAGQAGSRPFLDIHGRVKHSGMEQGLLGMAFHPDYLSNGYFYVNYTGVGDSTHISRFSVSPVDPDSAVPGSEFRILTIFQPYQNHNGGDLQFGPDGYLYIGLGDGGSAGDPGNRAQSLSHLLGKMLRIDINSGNPYSIPPDNPFVQQPGARGEIWALGLRNPWRFSFDRAAGDLWIADVGQGAFEEVDLQPASSAGGENYGWRCYEGNAPYNTSGCLPPQNYVFPVYEYPHDASPCWSVTGGYVYRGLNYPGFTGRYFFAEYCKDSVWALSFNAGSWQVSLRTCYPGNNFSSFGENEKGELFIAGHSSGKIFRIKDNGASGINGKRDGKRVQIHPNPFFDKVRISLPEGSGSNAAAWIEDLRGRIVCQTPLSADETWLNAGSLNAGFYFLHVEFEGTPEDNRIVRLIKL